jgi:hypothetical protein
MKWNILYIIFILWPILSPLGLIGQIDPYEYLNLNIHAQKEKNLLLIETFTTDKSDNSEYKKKYLSSREEYNEDGLRSLNLFFNPDASLHSKIVAFYPDSITEKNIFQQSGGFIDSAVFKFSNDGRRLYEVWYWGENQSRDTLLFSYNAKKQLTKVYRKYDWETKWDTLFYGMEGLLSKAVYYSEDNGLQKQVDFLFMPDSTLLKTSTRNPDRLIIEEEFFIYNNLGQIHHSLTKLYPEGKALEDPPQMKSRYRYYKNGQLKSITQVLSTPKKRRKSVTKIKYNKKGQLTLRHEKNKSAGINKKIQKIYTLRRDKK